MSVFLCCFCQIARRIQTTNRDTFLESVGSCSTQTTCLSVLQQSDKNSCSVTWVSAGFLRACAIFEGECLPSPWSPRPPLCSAAASLRWCCRSEPRCGEEWSRSERDERHRETMESIKKNERESKRNISITTRAKHDGGIFKVFFCQKQANRRSRPELSRSRTCIRCWILTFLSGKNHNVRKKTEAPVRWKTCKGPKISESICSFCLSA